MMKFACMILLAMALPAHAGLPLRSFRALVDHTPRAEYANYRVTGTVTIISDSPLLDGLYAIASADNVNYRGMLMLPPPGVKLEEGEVVDFEGTVALRDGNDIIVAETLKRAGKTALLPPAPLHKFVDFRKGRLHARRTSFIGWIDPESVVEFRDARGRPATKFHLTIWSSFMVVRVPGRLKVSKYEGAPVQVTGVGFRYCDASTGAVREIALIASSLSEIVSLREDKWKTPLLYGAGIVTFAALAVLCFIWAKARRERIENAAIAHDRRRLAAELHDTIEQHLATAKLYATGALRVPGLPGKAREALDRISATLVHAKMEVRDAVMNLRGEDAMFATLEEELRDVAFRISAGGAVRVRARLAASPHDLSISARRDILAIVNEAITNAIKHGHAKNILLMADDDRSLRIMNDGEKFDPASALGPETGHFGLSGMKERAARCALELSFENRGRWCGIRLAPSERS